MPTLQHLHAADSALTCRHTGIASVHGDVNLMWHRRDRGLCPPMGGVGQLTRAIQVPSGSVTYARRWPAAWS